MASLLGEDGKGFELARKLESHGVWRSWLGESLYPNFSSHCLASPLSWDSFMRVDDTKSRVQIQLQLRVRALLFDKATLSLFLRIPSSAATPPTISKLNPNYLQLHGNDVYFTLEDAQRSDAAAVSNTAPSEVSDSAVSYKKLTRLLEILRLHAIQLIDIEKTVRKVEILRLHAIQLQMMKLSFPKLCF